MGMALFLKMTIFYFGIISQLFFKVGFLVQCLSTRILIGFALLRTTFCQKTYRKAKTCSAQFLTLRSLPRCGLTHLQKLCNRAILLSFKPMYYSRRFCTVNGNIFPNEGPNNASVNKINTIM